MNSHLQRLPVSDANEQILLFQVRKFRDQRAFTRLFETYKKELYRFVRAKLPTAEDADDLIQTVFMRAWVYVTTAHAQETHHFRGLIYHMSRNAIADHYRQRKETFSVEAMEEAGMELADKKRTEASVHAEIDASFVKEKLRLLKEEYRDILTLRYFEGFDVSDIAVRLEKTENNVRVLLHRARKELQKHL